MLASLCVIRCQHFGSFQLQHLQGESAWSRVEPAGATCSVSRSVCVTVAHSGSSLELCLWGYWPNIIEVEAATRHSSIAGSLLVIMKTAILEHTTILRMDAHQLRGSSIFFSILTSWYRKIGGVAWELRSNFAQVSLLLSQILRDKCFQNTFILRHIHLVSVCLAFSFSLIQFCCEFPLQLFSNVSTTCRDWIKVKIGLQ